MKINTVADLLLALRVLDPKCRVTLAIANANDTAFTDDLELVFKEDTGAVQLRGWVASDNEAAFAPWTEEGNQD